jgi:glycosyltransferase involved in cell wall biosynthesis
LPQDRTPIRILIIPHQPHRNIKVRSLELARHLAAQPQYEVYVLTWRISNHKSSNLLAKIAFKAQEALETATMSPQIHEEASIRWVEFPYLLAPYPGCKEFNQQRLEEFVQKHYIQAVISANAYHFPMPTQKALLRIYDVVDDHISPDSSPHWRRTRAFTLGELQKSEHILSVSHALQAELAALGYAASTLLPNGVDWAAFQQQNSPAVRAIRERYGLMNRFTVGYIGNHGSWAGLDLLLAAFEQLQAQVPESRLLIVGPGEDLPRHQRKTPAQPGVIFTGPVPPQDIAAYFQAINLGVLTSTPSPFRDKAMPLKILEYGAARKCAFATPLQELVTLQFPHVRLLKPDAEVWGEALIQEALNPTPWNPNWDEAIAPYDWARLWRPIDQILMSHFGDADAPAV